MYHDGSNGARARSARIRTAHDDEANRLDAARRRGRALELQQRSRTSLIARLAAFLGQARANRVDAAVASSVEGAGDALVAGGPGGIG